MYIHNVYLSYVCIEVSTNYGEDWSTVSFFIQGDGNYRWSISSLFTNSKWCFSAANCEKKKRRKKGLGARARTRCCPLWLSSGILGLWRFGLFKRLLLGGWEDSKSNNPDELVRFSQYLHDDPWCASRSMDQSCVLDVLVISSLLVARYGTLWLAKCSVYAFNNHSIVHTCCLSTHHPCFYYGQGIQAFLAISTV